VAEIDRLVAFSAPLTSAKVITILYENTDNLEPAKRIIRPGSSTRPGVGSSR
jgi:hypothetical protein